MTHSIRHEPIPAGQAIVVVGDADASAAAALDEAVREAVRSVLAENLERLIIFDLSEANFLDSRTIGILLGWEDRLSVNAWRLPIVCSDPNLLRLFGVIGLDRKFEFFATRDEAVAPPSAGLTDP